MSENILLGDAIVIDQNRAETLHLSIMPENLLTYWPKVSDLANFIADFHYYDYPDDMMHNSVSTVLNELIENAAKFSHLKDWPIRINTYLDDNELVFQVGNSISPEGWDNLRKICHDLHSENLESLYLRRIENLYHNKSLTGIGLILLKKDYRLEMQFRLASTDSVSEVTITAKMKIS